MRILEEVGQLSVTLTKTMLMIACVVWDQLFQVVPQ